MKSRCLACGRSRAADDCLACQVWRNTCGDFRGVRTDGTRAILILVEGEGTCSVPLTAEAARARLAKRHRFASMFRCSDGFWVARSWSGPALLLDQDRRLVGPLLAFEGEGT